MTNIPRLLSIQDLCSFGRCAMTMTMPILTMQNIQTIPLVTSLFSNTPYFPAMSIHDLTSESFDFLKAWQDNGIEFDAIQSGFLASPRQIDIVKKAVELFGKDKLIIVDPAMADHGELYKVFDESMIAAMKALIGIADLITPNYTEATMMTNQAYKPKNETELEKLCEDLAAMGPKQVVITSIPGSEENISTAVYDATTKQFNILSIERIPINAPGTGDIFAAVLSGSLLNGYTLLEAVQRAIDFTYECIKLTYERNSDPLFGVHLESVLSNYKF